MELAGTVIGRSPGLIEPFRPIKSWQPVSWPGQAKPAASASPHRTSGENRLSELWPDGFLKPSAGDEEFFRQRYRLPIVALRRTASLRDIRPGGPPTFCGG